MRSDERLLKYILENLNKVLGEGNIVSLRMFVVELQTLQKILAGVETYMKDDVLKIFCGGEDEGC